MICPKAEFHDASINTPLEDRVLRGPVGDKVKWASWNSAFRKWILE